ncbi:indole-3-glycerol phosphate synthase [Buchnera aphidicola str. Bp (Baizongia pistaciae)]|uniref:Tryptophan biosynthesis protein TrpCF n=1 Tax=Buchnera aphidicola subsp. Baizongia pistaciae (strain Bp) TaxID=224915 RepID=TRPC_BUCBP|nr:RecName: Full=Tryptophan biosynthesis protein TrpCF; Includes: RecName: Full=Indole-3-glycerol phosphate synthase; Short=IGPS; Includes: RecName: Full=N-(5'-phospho-ribosyl)anthranilate isomerase; Short=PRAI [Buchnera aphidicola str. Bp (Baizongia pistaciae)]AAO26986.1 indole-3-glycerol phosphate synthase [Buchnera aphidicola str. Bp (Baizongia pistaciae)]
MNSILKEIINDKLMWVKYHKKKQPLFTFQNKIVRSNYNFKNSLKSIHPSYILEIKKASPSLGIINNKLDLKKISLIYKKYASSISILTDEKYFHGNFEFIPIVRKIAHRQPILCKDFFIDPYQIYLARYYQADAILLMLSILNDNQYVFLRNIAEMLNMDVLTEIENKKELTRAINLKSKIIGINNRNLNNLSIDIQKTKVLAPLIPKKIIIISESGIQNYNQIRQLKPFVQGFLIGSNLMRKKNLEEAVCKMILGNNKICGLTQSSDVKIIKEYGIVYGGLIFCKFSPRYINCNNAYSIINNVSLKYIGVFCNENLKRVAYIGTKLSLHAVQLHGNEDQIYINNLKLILPKHIKIWKSIIYLDFLKNQKHLFYNVNKYIIDNKDGGSGKTFNWKYLKNCKLDNVILAGGLDINNCILATDLGCYGYDFNSKLESSPGIKDLKKIVALTYSLRRHTVFNYRNLICLGKK